MDRPQIVILGAGLGGSVAAFEIKDAVGDGADVTLVSEGDAFYFVPSNPWVAVGWRDRKDVKVALAPVLARKGVGLRACGAERVVPTENRLALRDGASLSYDYLVIATGPDLAFDEIEGLGPLAGHTQSVCNIDHAEKAAEAFEAFCKAPGPIVVGAAQGASCFGPAYEFAMILNAE